MSRKAIYVLLLMALPVVLGVFGCASAGHELGKADTAIQEAEAAGADEFAPEKMERARALIAKAKELMARGDHKAARALLEEARNLAIEAKGEAWMAQRQAAMTPGMERGIKDRLSGSDFRDTDELQDIFFNYDHVEITSDSRRTLEQNARIIESSRYGRVIIEGYCDSRGTEEYNLALGQRRATSAKAFLVGLGVSVDRVEAVSRGETDRFAPGATESAFRENRRAHFKVTR